MPAYIVIRGFELMYSVALNGKLAMCCFVLSLCVSRLTNQASDMDSTHLTLLPGITIQSLLI
uniref:Uncharacterized protein n=1 Tax=Arundo donax TaxID=35708 RepID=A0A0A8Y089_ARUDO